MSYSVDVTVPAGTVASALTNFVVRVDLSHMPAGWWGDVAADGSNVRVKSAGTVIPFDVVWIDPATSTGELFFKSTLTTSASAFTVETVDGATALAATDPNGRNAVWVDYDAVVVGGQGINRVNGNALSTSGTVPPLGVIARSPDVAVHQGVALDTSGNFYALDTNAIKKYDSSWNLLLTRSGAAAHVSSQLGITVNHQNDGWIMDGELFVPFDLRSGSTVTNYYVVVYDLATLTAQRYYDLTSYPSYPWFCYNPDDGFLYAIDSGPGDELRKFDTSFVQQSVVTLPTSLAVPAGITYLNNKLYVTNDTGDSLWEIALDGSTVTKVYDFTQHQFGNLEGLDSDDQFLYVLGDGATSRVFTLSLAPDRVYFDHRGSLRATVPKRTSYSLGVTALVTIPTGQLITDIPEGFLGYGTNDATSSTRTVLGMAGSGASNRYGTFNTTDSWLSDTTVTPANIDQYRWNATIDGTTVRKLYRDGVLKGTDNTISARPTGAGDTLFFGSASTDLNWATQGDLRLAYLRNGILAADWLAAEFASWEHPETFYTVTEPSLEAVLDVAFPPLGVDIAGSVQVAFDYTFPAFRTAISGEVAQAGAATVTFAPFDVELLGALPDTTAGDLIVTFPSFRTATFGELDAAISTDTANDWNARLRDGRGLVETEVAVAPLPANLTRAVRVEKALAYPTPDLVDGRPT